MRSFVVAGATAVLVALVGGCAGGGGPAPPDESPPSAVPPEEDVPVAESKACEEVRTGIDAFNAGDYDATVEHFEAALPLAEDQDDGSAAAGDLVEAVRYYAELDAEAYLEASASSPEFAKYKAITLGQCVAATDGSESPGTDV
jgi:hypothetical protein